MAAPKIGGAALFDRTPQAGSNMPVRLALNGSRVMQFFADTLYVGLKVKGKGTVSR